MRRMALSLISDIFFASIVRLDASAPDQNAKGVGRFFGRARASSNAETKRSFIDGSVMSVALFATMMIDTYGIQSIFRDLPRVRVSSLRCLDDP